MVDNATRAIVRTLLCGGRVWTERCHYATLVDFTTLKNNANLPRGNRTSPSSHEYLYEKCSRRAYSLGDDLNTLPLAFRWVGRDGRANNFLGLACVIMVEGEDL
jgi:hypothetical protein